MVVYRGQASLWLDWVSAQGAGSRMQVHAVIGGSHRSMRASGFASDERVGLVAVGACEDIK